MVADSNTNSKSSSGSDKNTSSRSSSGSNTNSKGSSSGAGTNSGSPGGSVGGGMGGGSAGSGGNTNSKGNSSGADRNSNGGGSGFGGGNSPAGMNSGMGGSAGGGLNSAGNRASGAGPSASSNRSTTGSGFSGSVGTGIGGGMGSGLNAAGNRASGAGPGASSNTSTTGGGFGSTVGGGSIGFGGQNSPGGMANPSLGGMAAAAQDKTRQGDLAQQARASETKSMNDMADWGKEVKSVVAAGPGWTSVELNNGRIETRKGDRASRNNNPGNIEAGDFAKKAGAIGTDGRFAVFSSKEDGYKAIGALLGTSRYANKTVEGAISSYAPPSENNTSAYANTVAGKIGVSKDTPMSSLTASQRDAMARAITGVEGNTGYTKAVTGTDRFSSTYMGSKAASPASTTSTAKSTSQQNDPSGLPPGTYRGYDPSGLPADKPAPVKNTRADPASVVSGPAPTTPPTGEFPARPRTTGEKIAAAGIDIGLGSLPGIGMGVSLINGGLALTGNSTLGEHMVDSFATGKGAGTGPDSGANRAGGSGKDQVVKNTSTVPKTTESFEDKYMKFVDPTSRPTPAQRWDYGTTGYS